MTETETTLLNALERLESNRKQTEQKILDALQRLAAQVSMLEKENELLRSTQQKFSEQLAQQSEILKKQSETITRLTKR